MLLTITDPCFEGHHVELTGDVEAFIEQLFSVIEVTGFGTICEQIGEITAPPGYIGSVTCIAVELEGIFEVRGPDIKPAGRVGEEASQMIIDRGSPSYRFNTIA